MGGNGSKKKKDKKNDDFLHLSYHKFPSFYLKKKQMNNPLQPIPHSYVNSYWQEDPKKIFKNKNSNVSQISFQNINQNPLHIPVQKITSIQQPQTYIYPQTHVINVPQYAPIRKPFNHNMYQRGILIREEIIPMVPIRRVTKREFEPIKSETTKTTIESKNELKKSSSTIKEKLKKSFSKTVISKSQTNEANQTDSESTIYSKRNRNLKNESKKDTHDYTFSEKSFSKSRSRTRSVLSSLIK